MNSASRESSSRGPTQRESPLNTIPAIGVLRDRARSLHEERWLIRRLRKSVIARGAINVERLSGGLSNHNFAVRTKGRRAWFARICQEHLCLESAVATR